jgi:2Fe-2S ferredoxin
MAEVHVTDRAGVRHTIEATNERPLMETLRDTNLGVLGTCGGQCACGTCHVYVNAEWAARLPPKSEDEQMMLDAIGELVEVRPNSRLSCQLAVDDTLKGLEVEIGPVA